MSGSIIGTLIAKDLSLYFKNRFIALITVLGVVFYIVIYFVLPNTVDETLDIGIYAPELPAVFDDQMNEIGLILHEADSDAALQQGVLDGDYPVGMAIPNDLAVQLAASQTPEIDLYFSSELPPEFQEIYVILIEELTLTMVGQSFANINANEQVLGPDLAGEQIPTRNRMLPLFAIFVLVMETMGLSSLISMEMQEGTMRALLITPARVEHLFVAKTVVGVLLAFVQSALVLGITGGMQHEPLLMVVLLLLGSVLVTGIAFMIATVARDMMSVIGWGMLALIILVIPTFSVLLPGSVSGWIQVIPSHYLVDAVHQVINFGAGWAEMATNLLALAGFALLFLLLGVLFLRRNFR